MISITINDYSFTSWPIAIYASMTNFDIHLNNNLTKYLFIIKVSFLVERLRQTTHDQKVVSLIPQKGIIFALTIWSMDVG